MELDTWFVPFRPFWSTTWSNAPGVASGGEAPFGGWQRLNADHAKPVDVETPGWPARPRT
jgi:hypothetical protein